MSPTVKRSLSTIRDQVYQILKEDICNGKFRPGQWLQENELAGTLSISRSPVREALKLLVSDGLVVEIPNKGVFVKEFTTRDLEEVFDLRVLLENYAISQLTDTLTASGREQLTNVLTQLEDTYKKQDLHAYISYDAILHDLLIQLSGNNLLITLYARIHAINQQFRIYSLLSQKRFDESIIEHSGLIHNILSGNMAEAQRINHMHLEFAREKIIEHMNQTFSEAESTPKA